MAVPDKSMSWAAALSVAAAQLAPLPLPALAPVGLALGMAPVAAQWNNQTRNIQCSSSNNRPKTCTLPRNTQSVTFLGPDRSGLCREGETWRRRGNQLWVSGGCGGTFQAVISGSGTGGGNGWGNSGWDNNGGSWSGNQQGFAGEITCRSRNNLEERCSANTQNRVQLLQQYSNAQCIEGTNWRYDSNTIYVRNGCQARFGYGVGNWDGGSGSGWGGNQGFAGQLECRSDNNRYRRCNVNTENRVELLRQFSSSGCTRGRSWGYDRNSIWVDSGCQARFGYGYGNVIGDMSDNGGGGSNTGAIVGGVALAAGLVALLAATGKGSRSSNSSGVNEVARLDADLGKFPSDARASGEACLKEAARQVGATGGTAVRLERVDRVSPSGQGWMILAQISATYPDKSRSMAMDCRATGSSVTAFDIK